MTIKTDVYPVGALRDARANRLRSGVRHYLWRYAIRGRRWRSARNYFNGWLAEHEGCHHNAGRGWTKRAARRRVERIHALAPRVVRGDGGEGSGE